MGDMISLQDIFEEWVTIQERRGTEQDIYEFFTELLRIEAERIENNLGDDPLVDEMDPPVALYNRIIKELKDKGIYHEDS